MANALYNPARGSFAKKELDWLNDDIRVILIDTGAYTFSAAHQYLSSVPSGARISTQALSNKSVTANGACDADDTVYANVSGASIEACIIYKHTGVDSTAQLIAYLDTVVGLPFTPTGLSVSLVWDSGVSAIFRL